MFDEWNSGFSYDTRHEARQDIRGFERSFFADVFEKKLYAMEQSVELNSL